MGINIGARAGTFVNRFFAFFSLSQNSSLLLHLCLLAQCDGSPPFPCFVVEGILTIFSKTTLDSIGRFQVENAIQQTVSKGNLFEADNRFLSLTWSGFIESPPPDDDGKTGNWIFDVEWWILVLIALGIVLVLVVVLVICLRLCRRRRERRRQPTRQPTPPARKQQFSQPNVTQYADQVGPANGARSSSNSSIATSENMYVGNVGDVGDANVNDYDYYSDDQINESMMPNIDEPIEEERQEDLDPESINDPNAMYLSLSDDRYSYETIYQSNQALGYNPDPNQFGNGGDGAEYIDRSQNAPYDSEDQSRSLSRHNQEFRNLEGREMSDPDSPNLKTFSNARSPSNYSSDIHSNTSQQMSYNGDNAINDDNSSYEDVEEDFEIEYASHSDRVADEPPTSSYEEVWVDENDNTASNSNHVNTSSNTNTNGNSNSDSTFGSGSASPDSGDGGTPLPFLAHNAQLQQQQQLHQQGTKTSFDSLRKKWEQT
jgi:hypothetical protein